MSGLTAIRFRDLLRTARRRGASDVHLGCGWAPMLRVDGRIECLAEPALETPQMEELVAELFGAALETERTMAFGDEEVGRVRVHGFRAQGSPTLAVRLLAHETPRWESLELPASLAEFALRDRGLLIFAGATGSGKSTTLAGLVDRINRGMPRRILTLEAPIEYRHESLRSLISQREIGRDAETLEAAIVGALRSDPDVVVIGEMREASEFRAALTAAETGHLVVATLHTGDAAATIERIVGAFPGDAQVGVRSRLADVLVACTAQRLMVRRGGRGRRAVVEVLVATDAVRNLIREGRTHQLRSAMATGRQFGMQLFEQHEAELLATGELGTRSA